MRRTKEHDVLRESSFKRYGKTKHRTFLFLKSEEPDLMNQSSHQMREKFFFCWFIDLRSVICFGLMSYNMPLLTWKGIITMKYHLYY